MKNFNFFYRRFHSQIKQNLLFKLLIRKFSLIFSTLSSMVVLMQLLGEKKGAMKN